MSATFFCPNCTALLNCKGNGTTGAPWVIPEHASPADGEPCQEGGALWSRSLPPYHKQPEVTQ